jgi:hypothetical protein
MKQSVWFSICLAFAVPGMAAGEPDKSAETTEIVPALLAAGPLADAPGDGTRRKLLKAKYNSALQAARWLYDVAGLACGRDNPDLRYNAWKRVLQARLELCETPAERIATVEDYLAITKAAEKLEIARHEAGRAGIAECHRARNERLDAEIRLLRETQGAVGERSR